MAISVASRAAGVSMTLLSMSDGHRNRAPRAAVDFGKPHFSGHRDGLLYVDLDPKVGHALALQLLHACLGILQPLLVARLKALGVKPLPLGEIAGKKPRHGNASRSGHGRKIAAAKRGRT